MKRFKTRLVLLAALAVSIGSIHVSIAAENVNRTGNVEVVESTKKGKVEFKLIYTYADGRKVRGEYWEAVDPKESGKNKSQSNILAGTPVAKKYESVIANSKIATEPDIAIDTEKDGFALKCIKTVKYNVKGAPETVSFRGYTSYPVLGVFNLKTDWTYSYDSSDRLSGISEKNLSLDSLMLNMAAENTTKIERDKSGRPIKITRTIGAVPPVFETTEYSYDSDTPKMKKTIYRKCGIDMKKYSVSPTETITITYGSNVPWDGMKKYDFSMGKTIEGISVYDEANKKQLLDGSKFKKMSFIEKAIFTKNIVTYYKNEQKGPKWRMGELPDSPDPFLIYKDNLWYK